MAMMDVMEADDVEDFGRGNVRILQIQSSDRDFQVPDPLPASPDPTEPSTERVLEFPSRQMPQQAPKDRQTPRQATLPQPTPAVPGKPITVASQMFLEVGTEVFR